MSILTVNLESGMPTVDTAISRMSQAIRSAKAQRLAAVKLIHGYGSSGSGGRIKAEVHRRLSAMKNTGMVKEVVLGEDFSPFDAAARRAIGLCPELSRDRDYSRCNHGITVVVL